MFVAFDFDLNAVVGGVVALANADELRQALCVPNSPIMSNSCELRVQQMSEVIKQKFCVVPCIMIMSFPPYGRELLNH